MKKNIYTFGFISNIFFELVIWMLYLQHVGWSLVEIGVLQAVINLTQFAMEVPSGYLADKFGRKKTMMVGQGLIVLYSLSFLFAKDAHWIMYLGFFLHGTGLSLVSGSDQALMHDAISDDENRYAKVLGRYNALGIIGITISSILGGWLSIVDWSLVFILTAVLHVLAIIFLAFVPEKKTDTDEEIVETSIIKQVHEFFKENAQFKYLAITIAVTQGTISILYQYGSVWLSQFHYTSFEISIFFFVIGAFGAIFSYKVDDFIQKFNASKLVIYSLTLTLIFLIGLWFSASWLAVALFIGFNGLFEVWDTTLNTVLHDKIPDRIRATMVSIVNLFTALLMAFESISLGGLSELFGLNPVYIGLGVLSMVAGLFLFIRSEQFEKRTK